jgi:hypothetical protein
MAPAAAAALIDPEHPTMPTEPTIAVSAAEAAAFARRLGLDWIAAKDTARLREAMVNIARAGLVVPRVPSKFTQPAFTFAVGPHDDAPPS